MNEMNVATARDDLSREVIEVGCQVLDFLNDRGYSARFSRAGYSGSRDFAIFVINSSGLPNVAFRHLRMPQVIACMEMRLDRKVTVVVGRDEFKYVVFIVQLQVESELVFEPTLIS